MESSGQTIVRLFRDTPGHPALFEQTLQRIKAMSFRFDGNGESLINLVWTHWAQKTPYLGLWAVVQDDHVVSHSLGFIEQYNGEWVAWINQAEHDGISPKAIRDGMLQAYEQWVREFNLWASQQGSPAHVSYLYMQTPRTTEAWSRHVGFEPYRLICRRQVK